MNNRSETVALTGSTVRCRHCDDSKTISITRQKFWYCLSSILVLCLLLVSTALIFQSSSKPCDSKPETSDFNSRALPETPFSVKPSTTNKPFDEDPCLMKNGRRKKSKRCRESNPPPKVLEPLAPRLVGKYKQVKLKNMEAYLEQEGGNFVYQKMAMSVMPNLEIKAYSDVKYGQHYTAGFMYSKEWLMWTDGRKYEHEDALGDRVSATAIDNGETITITALGGKAGPMITVMSLEPSTGRLLMTLTLTDKNNVTAVRYFEPS